MIRLLNKPDHTLFVITENHRLFCMSGGCCRYVTNDHEVFESMKKNWGNYLLVTGENSENKYSTSDICWRYGDGYQLIFCDINGKTIELSSYSLVSPLYKFIQSVLDYHHPDYRDFKKLINFAKMVINCDPIILLKKGIIYKLINIIKSYSNSKLSQLLEKIEQNSSNADQVKNILIDFLEQFESAKMIRIVTGVDDVVKIHDQSKQSICTDQGVINVFDLIDEKKFIIVDPNSKRYLTNYAKFLIDSNQKEFWDVKNGTIFSIDDVSTFSKMMTTEKISHVLHCVIPDDIFAFEFSQPKNLGYFFTKGIKGINVSLSQELNLKFYKNDQYLFKWCLSVEHLKWFFKEFIFMIPYRIDSLENHFEFKKTEQLPFSHWPYNQQIRFHFSEIDVQSFKVGEKLIKFYRPGSLKSKVFSCLFNGLNEIIPTLKSLHSNNVLFDLKNSKYWEFFGSNSAIVRNVEGKLVYFIVHLNTNLLKTLPRKVSVSDFIQKDRKVFYQWNDKFYQVLKINHHCILLNDEIHHHFGKESQLWLIDDDIIEFMDKFDDFLR